MKAIAVSTEGGRHLPMTMVEESGLLAGGAGGKIVLTMGAVAAG